MALPPGTRLGPYEVTAQIGVGGMGEVYRATDTNLKRAVAIKVLPESVAGDAERLARFQREAEVLASLNHPNIAAIYGLERSGGTTALVMELVEGPTLADRIAQGAIPIDDALPIARQMAEALEAAHEQGIIHRDLKPANVKVRPDGMVKVLDFGLAKAMEPAPGSSPNMSMSPTITTPAMTQAGMILGTAAYMSPEQARGKLVDKRADIWAFGCVLFEMLTGRRAFAGDEVSDTLASVLAREPDWALLPPSVPPVLGAYLRRCLQKDLRQRIHDIADVRLALEGAFEAAAGDAGSQQPDPGSVQQQTDAAVAAVRRVLARSMRRRVALAVAAALIVGASAGAAVWSAMRPAPPPLLPETRTDVVTPDTADPISFALSPDGRQIVFVASGDGASRLWLRSLTATAAQPLAGTEGAAYPFWSPDSRSVGFFAETRLKRLDIAGGTPQTLATAVARGGTWNADGAILFAPSALGPLFRVPALGGQAVALTTLDGQVRSQQFPFFLPDGRQFLFYAQGTPETRGIYLGSLDSADMRRLTPADTAGVYLPSGWLLWVRAGTVVAQRLDLERKALTGELVTLADQVAEANSAASAVSVSAAGLVAYRTGGANRRQQLAWFDRSGKSLGMMGAPDENELIAPSVSPDGRRVAVTRNVQGNLDIWLLDGTRTSRFTFDAGVDRFPIWSSDGSWIVFDSNRKVHRDLYQKPSSGGSAEDLLVESPQNKVATDWSADGRFILYQSIDPQTNWDLWVLPLDGDRKPWMFLKTSFDERNGQFSPDRRWVAYMSNESGRQEIYIRPFAAPAASGAAANPAAGQWQVSTAGGIFPRWRPDGKELYYIGPNGEMMAAPITAAGTALAPGAPVSLFPTRIVGGGVIRFESRQYDVTRDGRFLINTVLDADAAPITLLQNWNPESKP